MSGHNLRADRQCHTLVPPLNSSINEACVSVQALPAQCHYSAGTGVVRSSLETTDKIECSTYTWDEWSYPQLLLLWQWGLSDPRISELCKRPQCFNNKLSSEAFLRSSGHVWGWIAWICPNPLLGEWRETLPITHHVLSPHPHVIICRPTSFISSTDCTVILYLAHIYTN